MMSIFFWMCFENVDCLTGFPRLCLYPRFPQSSKLDPSTFYIWHSTFKTEIMHVDHILLWHQFTNQVYEKFFSIWNGQKQKYFYYQALYCSSFLSWSLARNKLCLIVMLPPLSLLSPTLSSLLLSLSASLRSLYLQSPDLLP